MKKRNKAKRIINPNLIEMLKQVNLNGTVNECLLSIKKGKGKIESIDMTGNLIVISHWKVTKGFKTGEFGLGNINLLIKFLSTLIGGKSSFKINNNELSIKGNDGQRKLRYFLTEPELIATQLEFEEDETTDIYQQIVDMVEYSAELTQEFVKDYLSYVSMVEQKDTIVKFDGEETFCLRIGERDDHQIELKLNTTVEVESEDEKSCSPFVTKINGEHLAKIFSTLNYPDDDSPTISITEDKSVIIRSNQSSNNFTIWALQPLSDNEFEEEEEEDE